MKSNSQSRRWLRLLAGVLLMVLFVCLVHILSPSARGPAGQVFQNNQRRNFDASALFYTEVNKVADYLEKGDGKYYIKKAE